MSVSDYRYILKMMRRDRSVLGEVAVTTDFEPARECAKFAALRRGALSPTDAHARTDVEPIWHPTAGKPHISGFRVNVTPEIRDRPAGVSGFPLRSNPETRSSPCFQHLDFSVDYWSDLAQDASQVYVDRGLLKTKDVFYYSVMAMPADAKPEAAGGLSIEESHTPPVVTDGSLLDFMQVSLPTGAGAIAQDFPVFIPPRILEETEEIRLQAGAVETGGVLVGHLRRDTSIPEVFAEVTAQIPAAHTRSALTKLTFTSETWTDIRSEVEARGKGELLLGYWHSHPVRDWSRAGSESQSSFGQAGEFFSIDDCALMRAVFWQAYAVGLVITDVAVNGKCWTSSWSLYGWRDGIVQPRGFHVLDVRKPVAACLGISAIGGKSIVSNNR